MSVQLISEENAQTQMCERNLCDKRTFSSVVLRSSDIIRYSFLIEVTLICEQNFICGSLLEKHRGNI